MSDPDLELSVTRLIDAPPEIVYRVWTERLEEWWAPKPFTTRVVELDLRPGGRGEIDMRSPEGEPYPHEFLFLEVIPNRKIVATNVFTSGWKPKTLMTTECDFATVATYSFEPEGSGTRYTGKVLHWDEEALKKHEAMGFDEGWGTVTAQLAALAEAEAKERVAAE